MVHAAPHRHVVPESSRHKAARLLLQLKADEGQLGSWLDNMAQQIHDAPTNETRDEAFYHLKIRTNAVLQNILELAMIPAGGSYCQQRKAELGNALRGVMQQWDDWSQRWEASLPDATVTQFDAVTDYSYLNALLAKASGVIRRDSHIETLFDKGHQRLRD